MKKMTYKLPRCIAMLAMLLLPVAVHAGVTAIQIGFNAWTNSNGTNTPVIVTYNPPSGATTAENNYGTFSGQASGAFSLAESFQIPNVTNTYTLDSVQISISGGTTTNIIHLYDLGTNNGTVPTNPQNYGSATYTNTDLFSAGLQFTNPPFASQQTLLLQFNGADHVALQGNHKYVFEIDPVSTSVLSWYRGGANPPNPQSAAYRAQGNINGGGNWREFAMAVTFVGVSNLVSTNVVLTLVNPVPQNYGPPTQWAYFNGVCAPTDAGGTNTDEAFGANTVLGEVFQANRDFLLRNFYFALQGTTNSGYYLLGLVDLGTNSSVLTYGNTINPSITNSASNRLSSAVSYLGFTPNFVTNKSIVKFKLTSSNWQTLSNGHYYFLGFQYAGGGNNDMILERTSVGVSDASGAAYKGSTTSVANNGFGASKRNLLYAVDVLNPNVAFAVTNAALDSGWPTVNGTLNGGQPTLATYNDPGTQGGFLDESQNTAVPMGFGPSTGGNPGLALSMGFYTTNSFSLGAIALRQRGLGSSNCLFTVNIFEVTNTMFSQTNTVEKWPRNFQPNIDTSLKGIPISGTNLNFYYTGDNGTNGAGQGTNDQILVLKLNNPGAVPMIQNSNSYVIEITAETIGQNAATDGLFQWIRDVGQSSFEQDYLTANYGGIYWTSPVDNNSYNICPEGLSRTFTDPETYAGGLVGSGSPRTFVMALYSVTPSPASINLTSVTRNGNSVTLNWAPTPAGSYNYTVWRKTNLTDASWTQVTTGISTSTYTDTGATAGTGFYRVSSP